MHAQGFLHRDINPANVFVRENGTPVLLDFGAARQAVGHKSMSLTSIVSPGYAPLEQYASDGNQGPWTDVYSLSAVIFRAVTGQNPPEAVSRMKVDRVSQYLDGVAGRYSATFLAAIKLGMAVDEKMRPQSVAELRPVLLSESHSSSRDSQVAPRAKTTIVSMPSTAKRARSAPGMSAASRHATRKRSAQPWGWIGVGLVAAAGIGLMLTVKSAPTPAPNPGVVTQRAAPGPTAPAAPVEQPRAEQPAQAPAPSASESQPPAPVPVHTPAIAPLAEATVPPPAPVRPIDPGVVFPKAAPHLPKPPPKSNPALARDFQAADTDGDGAISAAEARARMPRLARDFERADANRDGRVTLIELQRFIHSGAEKGALP
jgi:hypothetical protein